MGAVLSGCAAGPGAEAPGLSRFQADANAIARMLASSAESWNRGDLDGFLDDYAEDATFVGGSGLIQGVTELERRYRASYWAGDGPREALRFADVRVTPLGRDHALAVGRFVLSRDGEVTSTGFFTLVLERRPSGWRIIHDHSSETG